MEKSSQPYPRKSRWVWLDAYLTATIFLIHNDFKRGEDLGSLGLNDHAPGTQNMISTGRDSCLPTAIYEGQENGNVVDNNNLA